MPKQKRRLSNYADYMYKWMDCYYYWMQRLYDMSYSCIQWEGLKLDENPSTMLLPENFLVDRGMCTIFKDEVMGFICLPCVGEGRLNVYGKPASYQAYGQNGYIKQNLIPNENCVVIYNNPMASTEHRNIDLFARRLTNSMITGDINLGAHKTPLMLIADEEQKFTAENLLADYEAGATKVFGNRGLSNLKLEVLDLKAPYIVDKIMENTQSIWNEWLNYLGVPGQVVQKKERMLKDEVTQTMGGSLASRVPRLAMRDKGKEDLKNTFGWDVEIAYRVDSVPIPEYIEGGGMDESFADSFGNAGNDDGEEDVDK